ncbi:MAG: hypothetical protein R8L07_13005 [Alphaproteobacteria bacterium]|nr:hypothetical protein [Alphaproteobacteria bacterium]
MTIRDAIQCFAITNFTPYASVEYMQADLCWALRDRDVIVSEHLRSDFPNQKLMQYQMAAIGNYPGRRFVMDVNAANHYEVNGASLYDAWTLPRFTFLTDSPFRKLDNLAQFPALGLIGTVDADFVPLIEELGLPGKGSFFFPHAGPPPRREQARTADRPIDVLVIGNVSSDLTTDAWLEQAAGTDTGLRAILDAAYERCRNGTEALWKVIRAEHEAADRAPPALPELTRLVNALETQLIAARRRDILAAIHTVKTEFHGGGEIHRSQTAGPAVTLNGPIQYLHALNLMQQAKIVIDVSPSFRNGAHERVFYALSRGAHVLTEPSRFLTREVEEDLGVGFLPFDSAKVEDAIREVLDRGPQELDAVRERALDHYARTHVWTDRADTLLTHMSNLFWDGQSGN